MPMLEDSQILEILKERKQDVPIYITSGFTNTESFEPMCKNIFKAHLKPVAPPLCFFEKLENDTYDMTSFFDLKDPDYTLAPFGNTENLDEDELARIESYGVSYNAFCGSLPIQSYTVCIKQTDELVNRATSQSKYFEEYGAKYPSKAGWSAGHLIAHQFTPLHDDPNKISTLQLDWNFIPEPYKWNCNQRNHIEIATGKLGMKYYGVYPIYSLRYKFGRTTDRIAENLRRAYKLAYRPLPDGEFFVADLKKRNQLSAVYVPFLAPGAGLYNSDTNIFNPFKKKIDAMINRHSVNYAACPNTTIFNLDEDLGALSLRMKTVADENYGIAIEQGNLFTENNNDALHQAAVVRYERAAAHEVANVKHKINCALLFSSLGNLPRTQRYISAIREHTTLLLDECDATIADRLVANRLYRDFVEKFPDDNATAELLLRIAPTY